MTCKAFVGQPAPYFETQAWDNGVKTINLNQYKGKYLLLFFYPFDFTFVCPTEIINFSEAAPKFRQMNCEVVGCSIDSHFVHSEWCKKPRNQGGLGQMNIPLLADISKQLGTDYGVLVQSGHEKGAAYRATFIIDAKGIIRHISINDLPVGRNVDEYIRLVQAFQFVDENGEVCPAKWKPGQKAIVPDHGSAKLKEYWETEHSKQH